MFYLNRMNVEAAEPRCLLIGRGCSVIGRHKLTRSSLKASQTTSHIITTTITLKYNLMSLKLVHTSITDYSSSSSLRLPKK